MRFALILALLVSAAATADLYGEELLLRPLSDGKVMALFTFEIEGVLPGFQHQHSYTNKTQIEHFQLYPRDMGQIMTRYRLEELQLDFTQGRWDYDRWGQPPVNAAASGVFLSALLQNTTSVDQDWIGLTNTLSGKFCASLNFLDKTKTTTSAIVFPVSSPSHVVRRFGRLPREIACTENLTPWIKLLPCTSKAGLASLLNAYKIYGANYNSMTIQVSSKCEGLCHQRDTILKLQLLVVMDIVRNSKGKVSADLPVWSLSSLFDRNMTQKCSAASISRLLVEKMGAGDIVSPAADAVIGTKSNRYLTWSVYDLLKRKVADISWTRTSQPKADAWTSSTISVERHLTGYGEERGGIVVRFVNRSPRTITVLYYDSLPWFVKAYMHTLKFSVDSHPRPDILKQFVFQPAIDRQRPLVLELEAELPPKAVTEMRFDFDKVLLRYTEYPPDANRGFDIGSATVLVKSGLDKDLHRTMWTMSVQQRAKLTAFNLVDDSTEEALRIESRNVLLSLPAPDFSMPYNVITLSSTVIALFFGSVFNLLVRSYQPVTPDEAAGMLGKLKKKFVAR